MADLKAALTARSVPGSAVQQLDALVRLLLGSVPRTLRGLILHGSAATSGFEIQRSDLDLLAIVDGGLTAAQRPLIGEGLLKISSAPYPIEISFVRQQALESWSHPCAHELHYGEDQRERFTKGQFEPEERADEDLAMHFTLARARGIDLLGCYPVEQLPPVPKRDFLQAILRDFEWAQDRAQRQVEDMGGYLLANACRTMAFLHGGGILSKSEGMQWCRANGHDLATVVTDVTAKLRLEVLH